MWLAKLQLSNEISVPGLSCEQSDGHGETTRVPCSLSNPKIKEIRGEVKMTIEAV